METKVHVCRILPSFWRPMELGRSRAASSSTRSCQRKQPATHTIRYNDCREQTQRPHLKCCSNISLLQIWNCVLGDFSYITCSHCELASAPPAQGRLTSSRRGGANRGPGRNASKNFYCCLSSSLSLSSTPSISQSLREQTTTTTTRPFSFPSPWRAVSPFLRTVVILTF